MDSLDRGELSRLVSDPIHWGCLLAGYTSFAIGGPAEALVKVRDSEELSSVLAFVDRRKVPWRVIGRGTNLLIRDEGFEGMIILLGSGFQNIEFGPCRSGKCRVLVGAGCSLSRTAVSCMQRGLAGLEFAGGIPGTIGGAVIMNAGAWGGDMAGVVKSVAILDKRGKRVLARDDLDFGYRCWRDYPKIGGTSVVIETELELAEGDPDEIRRRFSDFQKRRSDSQPKGQGSAGSFFKNPANDSAGRLIEASGLKGARVGGAMVSEVHANFLVNVGGATAADVLALMKLVQEKVLRDSGIRLDPEVHFI